MPHINTQLSRLDPRPFPSGNLQEIVPRPAQVLDCPVERFFAEEIRPDVEERFRDLEEEFVVLLGGEGDFTEGGVHVVGEVDLVLNP